MSSRSPAPGRRKAGLITRVLASYCHRCGICSYASRRPNSAFERLMRWHRGWCPAWKARTKVYGEKTLMRRLSTLV
jgi:hypothetical protein